MDYKHYVGASVYKFRQYTARQFWGKIREIQHKTPQELLLDMESTDPLPYIIYEDGEWDLLEVIHDKDRFAIEFAEGPSTIVVPDTAGKDPEHEEDNSSVDDLKVRIVQRVTQGHGVVAEKPQEIAAEDAGTENSGGGA